MTGKPQLQITIIVTQQDSDWLEKLEGVLRDAPPGVQIVRRGGSDWIGFEQIYNFFQGREKPTKASEVYDALSPSSARLKNSRRRNKEAAFAVLSILVEHEAIPVLVRCRQCLLPRTTMPGGCRCVDRGAQDADGQWVYSTSVFNNQIEGYKNWEISRTSLVPLAAEDIPATGRDGGYEKLRAVTRRRIIQFVASIH